MLIEKDVSRGFLTGFKVLGGEGEEMQISHLLFENDTLVFCKDEKDQMVYLSWILVWFEAFSGLKINFEKSSILPVGRVENLEELAEEFGCISGTLPTTYLGLPLGAKHNSTTMWGGVEERFRKRLALWKWQYISKEGRLILIKSTLSNMPIYTMSLFRLLKGVKPRLEKIQRDFLWEGGNLGRKPHLVNWKIVYAGKEEGDLGIKNLSTMNRALLEKWTWRFAVEENSLWKTVIKLKYGIEAGGWFTNASGGSYGLGCGKK